MGHRAAVPVRVCGEHPRLGRPRAALASTLFSVGALVAAPFAGRLSDRFNPVTVAVVAKLLAAVGVGSLVWAGSAPAFLVGMFVFGFGLTAAGPAASVLVLRWAGSDDRRKVFAYKFTGQAIGMAVGAFVAGQLVDLARADGMTCLRRRRPWASRSRPAHPRRRHRRADRGRPRPGRRRGRGALGTREALRRIFAVPALRWTALVTVALALGFYAQFESGLPAYALTVLDVDESAIGLAAAVNCLVIVALQVVVVRVTARRSAASLLMVVGAVWTLSWVVLLGRPARARGRLGALRHDLRHLRRRRDDVRPGAQPADREPRPQGLVGTTLGMFTAIQTAFSAVGPLVAGACSVRARQRLPRLHLADQPGRRLRRLAAAVAGHGTPAGPAPGTVTDDLASDRRVACGALDEVLSAARPRPEARGRPAAATDEGGVVSPRRARTLAAVKGRRGWTGWAGTSRSTSAPPTPSSTSGAAVSSSTSPRSWPSRPAPAAARGRHTGQGDARPHPRARPRRPPAADGVISDADVTERMLRYFVDQVRPSRLVRPRMVVCVPSEVTGVERRALEDAAVRVGARRVYVIEEPMAAAIGADLPVNETAASMVVDIGGGTTDVAVISLGGIVTLAVRCGSAATRSTRRSSPTSRASTPCCSGSAAPRTSRSAAGSAFPLRAETSTRVRGRDLVTGLPETVTLSSPEVRRAIEGPVLQIVELVRATLDVCPPELAGDILDHGYHAHRWGSAAARPDERMRHELGVPVRVADDPLRAVVRGSGRCVEDLASLERVLVGAARY